MTKLIEKLQLIKGQRVYQLTSHDGDTVAKLLPERGGLLYSLTMQGKQAERELLYTASDFWTAAATQLVGGMPICFPICGRLVARKEGGNYLYAGHHYELPMHGFVRNMLWQVIDDGEPDRITLIVTDTETSFKHFPFRFALRFEYVVTYNKLQVKQIYENRDDRSLPFYAGFHPYFLTPPVGEGKDRVYIDFKAKKHLLYNSDLTEVVSGTAPFSTPISVSNDKVKDELMYLEANNRVDLIYPGGDKLSIYTQSPTYPELFKYLQLYTQPDQPFICAEHWMAYPNALNEDRDLQWLARGNVLEANYILELS